MKLGQFLLIQLTKAGTNSLSYLWLDALVSLNNTLNFLPVIVM